MTISKKATDFKNQWLFNLVGPPGLEHRAKGLCAGLRNKAYLKSIGYK